jgi:hypothetical protein
MQRNFEIIIDELVSDEDFRDSFLRQPLRTLQLAGEWLPLTESELSSLISAAPSIWENVAEELDMRLQEAA